MDNKKVNELYNEMIQRKIKPLREKADRHMELRVRNPKKKSVMVLYLHQPKTYMEALKKDLENDGFKVKVVYSDEWTTVDISWETPQTAEDKEEKLIYVSGDNDKVADTLLERFDKLVDKTFRRG